MLKSGTQEAIVYMVVYNGRIDFMFLVPALYIDFPCE